MATAVLGWKMCKGRRPFQEINPVVKYYIRWEGYVSRPFGETIVFPLVGRRSQTLATNWVFSIAQIFPAKFVGDERWKWKEKMEERGRRPVIIFHLQIAI